MMTMMTMTVMMVMIVAGAGIGFRYHMRRKQSQGGVIDFQTGACRRNGDDGHDGDDYDGIGDQLPLPHTYIKKLALPEPKNCFFVIQAPIYPFSQEAPGPAPGPRRVTANPGESAHRSDRRERPKE